MFSVQIKTVGRDTAYTGPLKVIGVGFGRTGTASLKVALEKLLGAPCYHGAEVIENDYVVDWIDVAKGKNDKENIRRIFRGYCSTVDFPAAGYWEELLAAFPDAKVVLSVRDSPSVWFDSAKETIWLFQDKAPYKDIWMRILHAAIPFWRRFNLMADLTVDQKCGFNGDFSREHCTKVYDAWTTSVIAKVPKEKLLVFNVKEGYQPLCDFLGVPVPQDDPTFPKTNATKDFQRIITLARIQGMLLVFVPIAAISTMVSILFAFPRVSLFSEYKNKK